MKKIVRLTESDLTRLVKRIIKESEEEMDIFAKAPESGINKFKDKFDRDVQGDIEFDDTREFGPEEYEDFMEYINGCNTSWCIKSKKWYDKYSERGPITVGKKMK